MRVGVRSRLRHLASFAAGSSLGLLVDLLGFWLLVHAHVAPGVANVISSLCSIVVVFAFVTRRTFRTRFRPGRFVLFAGWYALNIATVSVVIERAVADYGHGPLLWKAALVPMSFLANYAFNLVLHRAPRADGGDGALRSGAA